MQIRTVHTDLLLCYGKDVCSETDFMKELSGREHLF